MTHALRRMVGRSLARQVAGGGKVRWCSSNANKSEGGGENKGLGAHFGADHEHKESILLKTFVKIGSGIEAVGTAFTSSGLGSLIAPKQQQVHTWGRGTAAAEDGNDSSPTSSSSPSSAASPSSSSRASKDKTVEGVPINTSQFSVIPVSEVTDHDKKETAWSLFKDLLMSKQYKTTQQQATDVLYQCVPDFSEPEFLEDIENKLLPSFLEAFWAKDIDGLKLMCSDACYHLHVEAQLKQYENMSSNCRLLMTRRANLFQRLMFIDDSDHAPSVKRRAELSEQGLDLDEVEDDLDVEEEKPEAIFFVSCSAVVENEWVDDKGDVKAGDRHSPEDWYFVFGLTPQPGPTWTLSSLEFTKMQAMA